MPQAVQHWCAVIRYPGHEPMMWGSTEVRVRAPQHEVELALLNAIARGLPDGFDLLSIVPGVMVFQPAGEGMAAAA